MDVNGYVIILVIYFILHFVCDLLIVAKENKYKRKIEKRIFDIEKKMNIYWRRTNKKNGNGYFNVDSGFIGGIERRYFKEAMAIQSEKLVEIDVRKAIVLILKYLDVEYSEDVKITREQLKQRKNDRRK